MNSDLEKEFYCSLKLVSGEEVVSLIMVDDSDPSDPLIVLQEPIIINYTTHGNISQIKIEPWMKMTTEDIFFIRLSKVITMTELFDPEMIDFYKDFLESKEEYLDELDSDEPTKNVSRKMGFLGSVQETKKNLEDIYKINFEDSDNKDS